MGSSLKGTSSIRGGIEGSDTKVRAGGKLSPRQKNHYPFSEPSPTEPQSWQVGAISETISTWLTLFAPPWRIPETISHPTYGLTQMVTETFPYKCMILAYDSQLRNPLKQGTADLSEPAALIPLAKWLQAQH